MDKPCEKCGSGALHLAMIPEHRPERLGLDGVVLVRTARRMKCKNCGEFSGPTTVPNVGGLMAAVAITRVKSPEKLTGKDIVFLRKILGLTGKALAEDVLQVVPETLSRWENNERCISAAHERTLRIEVGTRLRQRAPKIGFDAAAIATMRVIPFKRTEEAMEMCFIAVPSDETKPMPSSDEATDYVGGRSVAA